MAAVEKNRNENDIVAKLVGPRVAHVCDRPEPTFTNFETKSSNK